MKVGIIGGGRQACAAIVAHALANDLVAAIGGPQPVRYTYRDDDGDFTRAYAQDNVSNRHTFVKLLQGTEFCYQESDIQKFLTFAHQRAITVENI
ncbi:hypothetical protein BRC2024_KCUCJSVR_CDS_0085 [Acinetobacter phage vB_AbaM_KissB]|uniref:hypothetical protein n=1 Tax=Acinetobacter phage vB_AbaM_phiAbaA1 TaxID=1605379 RepID=UPI00078E3C45|nr:hypothetical protein BJD49_gp089 [Acinetobacter phage vB_AbaM_phiAbaA1]AJK27201.1 hypothetical protein phiAbaA1_098 [Acinetobacter phage vB_AbaM_phiAbaA1]